MKLDKNFLVVVISQTILTVIDQFNTTASHTIAGGWIVYKHINPFLANVVLILMTSLSMLGLHDWLKLRSEKK